MQERARAGQKERLMTKGSERREWSLDIILLRIIPYDFILDGAGQKIHATSSEYRWFVLGLSCLIYRRRRRLR